MIHRPLAAVTFIAAGADPQGRLGEDHTPEPHLIPLVLLTALGRRKAISIFGTDYPTPDGTCIRDYVHVTDLAQAHVLGLEYLLKGGKTKVFNLGNGNGFSVREVIEMVSQVTGQEISTIECDRRPGDPPVLVGSSDRVHRPLVSRDRLVPSLGFFNVFTKLKSVACLRYHSIQ